MDSFLESFYLYLALMLYFIFIVIILSFLGVDFDNSSKQEKVYIVRLENVEVINEIK